jgi:hypothetical protein
MVERTQNQLPGFQFVVHNFTTSADISNYNKNLDRNPVGLIIVPFTGAMFFLTVLNSVKSLITLLPWCVQILSVYLTDNGRAPYRKSVLGIF